MDETKPKKGKEVGMKVTDVSDSWRARQALREKKKVMKQMIMLFLSVILVMSAFAAPVVAHDDDDDGVDDEIEHLNERDLHIDVEPYEVELKSVLVDENKVHEIEVEMDAEDKIVVKFEFSTHNATAEPEIEVSLVFREIIEFSDDNGNGAFDDGDDEVSSFDLRDTEYDEIDYFTRTTDDGETEHVISSQTSNGVFKVVMHAVEDFAVIESGVISPSEVKLDLIIEDYPYQESGTQLALLSKLETHLEIEEHHEDDSDDDDDEDEVHISSPDAEAFFSWANNATVDGVVTPVEVTIEPDSGGKKIYFTYERGDSINHDPKLGVPYLTLPSDSGVLAGMGFIPYLLALVVGSVVVGAAVMWRRKKNGELQQ